MDLFVRPVLQVPVIANEFERGVVGFRSGIRKQNMLVAFRQQRCELRGKFRRPRIRRLEEVIVIGKRLQRLAAGFGEFGIAVADLDAPEPRHPVDDLVAFRIPQINTVGAGDHAHPFAAERGAVGKRMNMMRGVERLPMFGEIVFACGHGMSLLTEVGTPGKTGQRARTHHLRIVTDPGAENEQGVLREHDWRIAGVSGNVM